MKTNSFLTQQNTLKMPRSIPFTVRSDPCHTWMAWGNTSYATVADAIGELIDNSLQSGASECYVDILEEDGKRYLTIEDNGTWSKIDDNGATLAKCFGYGNDPNVVKVGLNEHNCGLKQVLAYTDPTNTNWCIQIKQNSIIWQLKAPYSNMMTMQEIDDPIKYIGRMSSAKNSTIIQSVISDTQFKTLYLKESTTDKKPHIAKLMDRLTKYLQTMWMMNDRVKNKTFKIFLNEKYIEPLILESVDGVLKNDPFRVVEKMKLSDETDEMTVETWDFTLGGDYKLDHPLFRKNPAYAGACIFKHGRLVKARVFEDIYKKLPELHYSGHLILVNITGNAKDLPSTHTTKNDFNNRDKKLEKLYDYIVSVKPAIPRRLDKERKQNEKELVKSLIESKKKNNERLMKKNLYDIYDEYSLPLSINGSKVATKERIDLFEWNRSAGNLVTIYEAKLDAITSDNLRQLYFYYRNLKYFCPDYTDFEIEVKFITKNPVATDGYETELMMIQEREPDFKPIIEAYASYSIYD